MKSQLNERRIKILSKLADAIEEIENDGETLMIKFKGNIVLKNDNFINLTDGFSINYATQIHLNPDYPRDLFEQGLKRLEDIKIGIVKNIVKKLGQSLSENEIQDIVKGNKQIEAKMNVDNKIDCY